MMFTDDGQLDEDPVSSSELASPTLLQPLYSMSPIFSRDPPPSSLTSASSTLPSPQQQSSPVPAHVATQSPADVSPSSLSPPPPKRSCDCPSSNSAHEADEHEDVDGWQLVTNKPCEVLSIPQQLNLSTISPPPNPSPVVPSSAASIVDDPNFTSLFAIPPISRHAHGFSHSDSLSFPSSTPRRSLRTSSLPSLKSDMRLDCTHCPILDVLSIKDYRSDQVSTSSEQQSSTPRATAFATNIIPDVEYLSRIARQGEVQRVRADQSQRCLQTRTQAYIRTSRLVDDTRYIRRTLAECIRSEEKPHFVNLFNSFQDAAQDSLCDSVEDADTESQSFIDQLPPVSRSALIEFLRRLRYDDDFVADRLASLPQHRLLALLSERLVAHASASVFTESTWNLPNTTRRLGYVIDNQIELLVSGSFVNPLETLIYCVRGVSHSSLAEDHRARHMWSAICARLLADERPGGEKVVPAILDVWSAAATWPGQWRFQSWLLKTLQRGAFILEHPNKSSFRMRMQSREDGSSDEETQAEAFYKDTILSLLDLLADQTGPSIIPETVLCMCNAIWHKLGYAPHHQRVFAQFVATRWLLSHFLCDILVLPESHGLMQSHHISELMRHRLLRELAVRSQKAIFDVIYSWKHGNPIDAQLNGKVCAVLKRIQGEHQASQSLTETSKDSHKKPADIGDLILIRANDVVVAINAIYPPPRPSSFSSDHESMHAGLRSSASSISGISLFSRLNQVDPPASPSASDQGHASLGPHSTSPSLLTNQDGGSITTSKKQETTSISDAEQMREVCSLVEDAIVAMPDTSRSVAAMLQIPPESTVMETTTDILRDIKAESSPPIHGDLTDTHKCQAVFRDLLSKGPFLETMVLDSDSATDQKLKNLKSCLVAALNDRIEESMARKSYIEAHEWATRSQWFQDKIALPNGSEWLVAALQDTETHILRDSEMNLQMARLCDDWQSQISLSTREHTKHLLMHLETCRRLRDKMWFIHDVRTSAAYDELRSVAGALRVMAKSKRSTKTRLAVPPLRHWNTTKAPNTGLHLKTEVQILDLLSVGPEQGGPNKLSDDQSRITASWMEQESIENFCRGEERLHKFCMEIRKCVDKITAADSTILWANSLYSQNHKDHGSIAASRSVASLDALRSANFGLDSSTLHSKFPPSIDAVSNSSNPISSISSREFLRTRSPAPTNRSSRPFWSPVMTEAQSPSSVTSFGSSLTHFASNHAAKRVDARLRFNRQEISQAVQKSLLGLLLSDLTTFLFAQGSETDQSYWCGVGGSLTQRHLQAQYVVKAFDRMRPGEQYNSLFDIRRAIIDIMGRFSEACDPFQKLESLHQVNQLIPAFVAGKKDQRQKPYHSPSFIRQTLVPSNDACVEGFRIIFCDNSTRPRWIFRDMQYIAALVPQAVLDSTDQGKAFCNAAVALLELKQELAATMVETADSIIAHHSNNRESARSLSSAQAGVGSAAFSVPIRTPSAEEISCYSMADAASLLQITAREGDAVAQRELATLYLTHPELMDHVIAPFARPRDVFKEELESKWRRNQDPHRCDPTTMCVAHHWMNLSSKGGDALAKEYLRQREEMENLP